MNLSARRLAVVASAFCLWVQGARGEAPQAPEVPVSVQKIWDQAPHNAFTDLMKHDGRWFCVFREGDTHASMDGTLRVLESTDGKNWTSAALVTMPGLDLRDAKISVTPDGKLMLCGAAAKVLPSGQKGHQTYVWFSDDGRSWSDAHPIGDENYWIWRIVWHEGVAYGFGYETGVPYEEGHLRLYRSKDGKTFETLVSDLGVTPYPNESDIVFQKDGTALCVLRRKGAAALGVAQAPYTDWTWKSLEIPVGGPAAVQLPDGRIIVGGRKYKGGQKTHLWWLDSQAPALTELTPLPSGGDTSYPGLVVDQGELWVSYYSSHEGKSNIYLGRLPIPALAE